MQNLTKLFVVLPCHSLEDFPTHVTGEDAQSLLANWTALWHPLLIASTQAAPQWISHDFVDKDLSDSLIFVPTLCGRLPAEFESAVEHQNAVIVAEKITRQQILDTPSVQQLTDSPKLCPSIVNDFFALSYAYLQIQIMTRQLRFSTSLDYTEFEKRVVNAAECCLSDSEQHIKQQISSCFDLLLEEKNNFYPTQPHLMDLVLIPPSGKLQNELQVEHKLNFCLAGNSLDRIQNNDPNSAQELKKLVLANHACFTTSTESELPIQLVSMESVVNQLCRSVEKQKKMLGVQPSTFAGFEQTIGPQVPAILDQFKFESVVHTSFVGDRVPPCSSPVINWQGCDGTNISALTVRPIDANCSDDFLKLSLTIGEMLDSYHHAEVLFVHWPGKTCDSFVDLVCCEKYGGLLGAFQTFDEFNQSKFDNGFSDTFELEDYKSPFLINLWQQKRSNPISIWASYWRRMAMLKSAATALAMIGVVKPKFCNDQKLADVRSLQHEVESSVAQRSMPPYSKSALKDIGSKIGLEPIFGDEILDTDDGKSMLANPTSYSKSVLFGDSNDKVDASKIESFELAVTGQAKSLIHRNDPALLIQSDHNHPPTLRNEFFEIAIDDKTGGIKSVNRHQKKGNLFSQQLSCRMSQTILEHGYPRQRSRYAVMKCHQWNSVKKGKAVAAITTQGAIVNDDQTLVEFRQTISIKRGDPKIYFVVELDIKKDVTGPPWRNYIANRIAWPEEDAEIYRSENELSDRVYQEKFTSPLFVEIRSSDASFCLLSGGLPFHRRSHRRMLDTLLVVENENAREFEYAISVDPTTAMSAAQEYLSPLIKIPCDDSTEKSAGWLFHLNCRNTVLTSMTPTINAKDEVVGVTLRIQETEGRSGNLKITCPRKVAQACRTDFLNENLFDLKFHGDVVESGFLAYQFFQIEIAFAAAAY